MSLLQEFHDYFPLEARENGAKIISRAKLLKQEPQHFIFEFGSKENEQTSLEYQDTPHDMTLQCTCERYQSGEYCEHLWASLLSLQRDSLVPGFEKTQKPALDKDSEAPETGMPSWRDYLESAQRKQISPRMEKGPGKKPGFVPLLRTGIYAIDFSASVELKKIKIQFFMKEHLANGAMTGTKAASVDQSNIHLYPDPLDQDILFDLIGKTQPYSAHNLSARVDSVLISPALAEPLLKKMAEAGKLFYMKEKKELTVQKYYLPELAPLEFSKEMWSLHLVLNEFDDFFFLNGNISNGRSSKKVRDVNMRVENLALIDGKLVLTDFDKHNQWFDVFQRRKEIEIPSADVKDFLNRFYANAQSPQLALPDSLKFTDLWDQTPLPQLTFSTTKGSSLLLGQLDFVYNEKRVSPDDPAVFLVDVEKSLKIHRAMSIEERALADFSDFKPMPIPLKKIQQRSGAGYFSEPQFKKTVLLALDKGWKVVAHQKNVKRAGDYQLRLKSNVDWFDVGLDIDFEGEKLNFPQLLQSIQRGEKLVQLGDGSFGILPEEWVKQFRALGDLAQVSKDSVRLNRIQALFFSAHLQSTGKLKADEDFQVLKKIVEELRQLEPQKASPLFKGDLRSYQETGLSWLSILSKNHIGGVLADDMGLGKTIQVLALLAEKPEALTKTPSKGASKNALDKVSKFPDLIVMPKSLIFNWQDEIKKFTPHLTVIDYTGPKRQSHLKDFENTDVILTTYPTLRMDIDKLQEKSFRYFVLDEAHTIKNANSQASMACRLIQAKKKLALTGTPVENSLADLFSILSVVNPGLISDSQSHKWVKEKDPEILSSLGRALSPFLLRRTKEEVLKDLPPKTEQILYCELSPEERKNYEELKAYYWSQLTGKISEKGLDRSKIEVLEALLRLRQAACHQGLLKKEMRDQASSKFEVVLDQIENLVKEGHKALIFSQFTSLLELFQNQLRQKGIPYEYLDGQTKNRQERVENFQNNPSIPLFLLSLKAGGIGLNLTAADYVFILDPWWNPAAEAQAIDRTHRIGQAKSVFAYKIIAKDTVEEKILEIQKAKKTLAKAIISDEKSILKSLKVEDLQALFA